MKRTILNIKSILLKLLSVREWAIVLATFSISGLLISSIFWFDSDDNSFDPNNIEIQRVGYDVFVKNTDNHILNIFNSIYEVRYQKVYPETFVQMVRDIIVDNVPFIHKIADRHHIYRYNDIDQSSPIINNLAIVNQSIGTDEWIEIPQQLYFLFEQGIELTIATDSMFNIFVGEVVSFWEELLEDSFNYLTLDPYYDSDRADLLNRLTSYIPISEVDILNTLELNIIEQRHYVKFNGFNDASFGDLSITLAGIAKGYANDIIAPILNDNELEHGFIYGGASSITTLGDRYGGNPWHWRLEGPTLDTPHAFYIERSGQYSFSTSGGYMGKNIPIDDESVLRHHIINPKTGYPAHHQLQINVMSQDLPSFTLDSLSTALMNMTIEEGLLLKNKFIDKGYELEIAWINIVDNGNVRVDYTSGYQSYIIELDNLVYEIV